MTKQELFDKMNARKAMVLELMKDADEIYRNPYRRHEHPFYGTNILETVLAETVMEYIREQEQEQTKEEVE